MSFMVAVVIIDAPGRCYGTGQTGQLSSHCIEILDLPVRPRVLLGLMLFRGTSDFFFLGGRSRRKLMFVCIECVIRTDANCGIGRRKKKQCMIIDVNSTVAERDRPGTQAYDIMSHATIATYGDLPQQRTGNAGMRAGEARAGPQMLRS